MKVIILGNGISGITAARTIRKLSSSASITVISSESKYFYSRTSLMYMYMGHMKLKDAQPYENDFWEANRIDLVQTYIQAIDFDSKSLIDDSEQHFHYDKLILATGSSPNMFNWEGIHLNGVSGLYSLQDLERIESLTQGIKSAAVIGGGLIGIELAEMLHARNIEVSILVREHSYWNKVLPKPESEMVNRHIINRGINLQLGVEMSRIIGNDQNECVSIETTNGEQIKADFVGITIGVHPNINFLKNSFLSIDKGILVDSFLKTNVKDVYAIGDCAQLKSPKEGRRPIEAIWYTGRMMGEVAGHNVLGGEVLYDPGLWFNSAKFFDLEYQVYGYVPVEQQIGIESVCWVDVEKEKLIRIVYDTQSKAVLGFNLLGIRFRHEVCEQWILEKTKINDVVKHLPMADFDPEFYKPYTKQAQRYFNEILNLNISTQGNRSLNKVLSFLNKRK